MHRPVFVAQEVASLGSVHGVYSGLGECGLQVHHVRHDRGAEDACGEQNALTVMAVTDPDAGSAASAPS